MSFWELAYKRGWATLDQLKQAVALGIITPDEYKKITGLDYTT